MEYICTKRLRMKEYPLRTKYNILKGIMLALCQAHLHFPYYLHFTEEFHQGAPKFSSIKQHQLFIISYGFYGSGILWFSHVDLVRVPQEAAAGKWPGLGFSPKVSLLTHLSPGMLWSAE